MALTLQVAVTSASPSAIVVQDSTGNYDPVTNPGGWGTPNPAKSSAVGVLLSTTPLSFPEVIPTRLNSTDQSNYLYQTGPVNAPVSGTPIRDGVYTIVARVGFASNAVSAIAGSNQFTMTGANAIFAPGAADGFTLDGLNPNIYYQIDRTQPLTATGGYVIQSLPAASNQTSTVYNICSTMTLIYQTGQSCLLKDIAKYAGSGECCEGDDLYSLMSRYAESLGMLQKFNNDGDFAGADFIAKKLQRDCLDGDDACFVQGLQPNVPFTGNGPIIITQPLTQDVSLGSSVAFTVVATGTAPLSYQWYKNGVPMPGQTGSNLNIDNVQPTDAANYYVIVSNAFNSVQSNTVSLVIGTSVIPVSITQQPTSQAGQIGGSATFTLVAAGTGPITYQWFFNGSPISGAINPSLTINNIQSGNFGNYWCVVTGPSNNVQSNTVQITQNVNVGWGWTTNPVPLQSDINAAQGTASNPSGSKLVADFTANTNPRTLFAFEPSTEPAKTRWYGSITNNGNIGDPNNDLFVSTIIGSNRVYYSVFPTLQTSTTIEFLTSSQTP